MMVNFPAWLSPLRNFHQRLANAKTVANPDLLLGQLRCADIFTKSPGSLQKRMWLKPETGEIRHPARIMFWRIKMHRLVDAAVDGTIGHLVTLEPQLSKHYWAIDRLARHCAQGTVGPKRLGSANQQRVDQSINHSRSLAAWQWHSHWHLQRLTLKAVRMQTSDLRIALFSGNYNYVRDGANQALNRLVGYLLKKGASVRVYSPTVDEPAFPATGDLVGVPSIAIPNRPEYRIPVSLSGRVKRDLDTFSPNVVQISSPDRVARQAVKWARKRNLPVLCSVHTRFETYLRYYNMSFAEPLIEAWLRRLYRKCDALVAPSESFAQVLREQRMNYDIDIWSRGVDRDIFNPGRRDLEWRRAQGLTDQPMVIGFLGRLVMEKGLDVFSDAIDQLRRRSVPHQVMVIGEGPARGWFESRLPHAKFVGFQGGADLGRAVAAMDLLFNPSVTETFGNVTLEAMACGLPVVAAKATGSQSLVDDKVSGRLIIPGAINQFADALQLYCTDDALRRKHGDAGEARSLNYSWDAINQTVADTYIRLIRQRAARTIAVG